MSYYSQPDAQTQRSIDQYIVNFEASCEVTVVLDHLKSVVTKLSNVRPPQTTSTVPTDLTPAVTFSAGELIGYVGGEFLGSPIIGFYALDLRLYNTAVKNGCEWSQVDPTTHCPFDYFSPSLKTSYLSVFGYEETLYPQTECNSPCRNVKGKIAGKWFLPSGAEGDYGEQIAIDLNLTGTTVTASSASGSSASGNWMMVGTGANPRTSAGPACFEEVPFGRHLYVSNVTTTSADIATGTGACPSSFPSSGFKTYVR